jgi:hypothetical protein
MNEFLDGRTIAGYTGPSFREMVTGTASASASAFTDQWQSPMMQTSVTAPKLVRSGPNRL